MEAENSDPFIEIVTYHGKNHKIPYDCTMTTGQLKAVILSIDNTVPDFSFLYAGRVIKSNEKVLGDFMDKNNMKLYTNANGVHGGCFKVGTCA